MPNRSKREQSQNHSPLVLRPKLFATSKLSSTRSTERQRLSANVSFVKRKKLRQSRPAEKGDMPFVNK